MPPVAALLGRPWRLLRVGGAGARWLSIARVLWMSRWSLLPPRPRWRPSHEREVSRRIGVLPLTVDDDCDDDDNRKDTAESTDQECLLKVKLGVLLVIIDINRYCLPGIGIPTMSVVLVVDDQNIAIVVRDFPIDILDLGCVFSLEAGIEVLTVPVFFKFRLSCG